jgi:hypothetical protein
MNGHNLNLLPVPLPPMLPEMVGIVADSRYFAMFYMGSKATWTLWYRVRSCSLISGQKYPLLSVCPSINRTTYSRLPFLPVGDCFQFVFDSWFHLETHRIFI